MPEKLTLNISIRPEQAGTYFTLPFHMPAGVETFHLRYDYERHRESGQAVESGAFTARREVNIVDLGLIAPDGTQVGASGSDKREIEVSETHATPGYKPHALEAGEWRILVGAYKIQPEGLPVTYELTFTPKRPRLLKGDLHAHTLASDGVQTAEELAYHALRHGLDFLAITDHNQMVTADALPRIPGLTVIPGHEWTHYLGHANFLGVEKPYDGSFATQNAEETRALFESARERGALITLNHPFETGCSFELDMTSLPFDCLEVWNGPMREPNLRAIGLWQSLLAAGRKIPACGGSDYHRSTPFLFLGGPTTCVFTQSAGLSDILAALRQGHAYITFSPEGPGVELAAGDAVMGDSVRWSQVKEMRVTAQGLLAGDVVRVVTATGSTNLLQAPAHGRFETTFAMPVPGFARVEILRAFLPGLPLLPALLSNPIYFDD